MFTRLLIPRLLLDSMVAHARAEAPNECCGLLGGFVSEGVGYVTERYPIRNDLASRTEYLTNARDLLDAVRAMRPAGIEVLAVYHSHPTSAPVPSRKDVERNTWGETVVHLIVGMPEGVPEVRAWWLAEAEYREAEFAIV